MPTRSKASRKPGASAINALLGFDSELGVALLGVEDEGDVKKAGNQLAPETWTRHRRRRRRYACSDQRGVDVRTELRRQCSRGLSGAHWFSPCRRSLLILAS